MDRSRQSRSADIGLRLLGLALGLIAYAALAHLLAWGKSHLGGDADWTTLGLAAIGVLSASAGGASLCLGPHLFDQVEVSPRWRPRSHST